MTSELLSLNTSETAYMLCKDGFIRDRLIKFTGAQLEISPGDGSPDGGRIKITGTPTVRELARLCVDIVLQQRNNGRILIDTAALEARRDVSFIDVPTAAVGFILVLCISSLVQMTCSILPLGSCNLSKER